MLLPIQSFTLFTVGSFVAGVAHTVTRHAQSVSAALRIDTLGGRDVTLGALPAAVALAAPPGVLPVTAAQDGAGSCGETGNEFLKLQKCQNITDSDITFVKPMSNYLQSCLNLDISQLCSIIKGMLQHFRPFGFHGEN